MTADRSEKTAGEVFTAGQLETIVAWLTDRCPAPEVTVESLADERGRLELAKAAGRHEVFQMFNRALQDKSHGTE